MDSTEPNRRLSSKIKPLPPASVSRWYQGLCLPPRLRHR